MFYHMNRFKLSWVILSFTEWWVRSREVLVIYRSFSFAYHCFSSLKCLACQLPTPGIDIHIRQTIPLTTKPKISTVSLSNSNSLSKKCSLPITPSSWSMGHLLKKKTRAEEKKRRQDPYLHSKELNKELKQKDRKFSKCESISSLSPEYFTFHKIGIWSSTNLWRTTLWLGNTGNQGMIFLPKTPHISLRIGRRWSKFPTMVRIIHLERLESTIGES